MGEWIVSFFGGVIENKYLLCAVLSVFPITEIKGGILCAAVAEINLPLAFACCFGASVLLSAVLCAGGPVLLRIAERSPIVKSLTSFLTDRLEEKAERIASKAKGGDRKIGKKLFALFAFVALPLPLTGVWAGALLAAILRLDYKNSLFALSAGNFTAGGVVLFVALVAGEKANLVLNLFLLAALAALLAAALKWALGKRRAKKEIG